MVIVVSPLEYIALKFWELVHLVLFETVGEWAMWRGLQHQLLPLPLGCTPTIPRNLALFPWDKD